MTPTPPPCLVHVLSSLKHGGNETQALTLLKHWPGHVRHLVIVLDGSQSPLLEHFQQWADVRILPASGLQRFRACHQILNRACPQAMISYTFKTPLLPVVLAARLAGIKAIAIRIGNTPQDQAGVGWRWNLLARLLQFLGATLHPVSQAVKKGLEECGLHLKNQDVMLNGVSLDSDFSAKVSNTKEPLVLMVARLDPIKDQATLIRAFVAARRPGWKLQLLGEGPQRLKLHALCIELGIDPAEVLKGACSDVPQRLSRASVFAFSTTAAEGSPNALLEAMAAGLPILASDVAPCRELLSDGRYGQLLKSGDVQAWTEALGSLIDSQERRCHWSARASDGGRSFDATMASRRWSALLRI